MLGTATQGGSDRKGGNFPLPSPSATCHLPAPTAPACHLPAPERLRSKPPGLPFTLGLRSSSTHLLPPPLPSAGALAFATLCNWGSGSKHTLRDTPPATRGKGTVPTPTPPTWDWPCLTSIPYKKPRFGGGKTKNKNLFGIDLQCPKESQGERGWDMLTLLVDGIKLK